MNYSFKTLVLLPNIFFLVILGSFSLSNNLIPFLILLIFVCEHLYQWNLMSKKLSTDFRLFFTDQLIKYIYNFSLYIVFIPVFIFWDYITWKSLFIFAFIFYLFRKIPEFGFKRVKNMTGSPSKIVSYDNALWNTNKDKLRELCMNCNDINLRNIILENLEYSSFLRSHKATNMINSIETNNQLKIRKVLNEIKKYL